MKYINSRTIKIILALFVIMILPTIAHATDIDFGDEVTENAPIDGGLSLLIAAGVGYGAKKIKKAKNLK